MFLDTSGLLCLHDVDDEQHAEAQRWYDSAHRKVTTSYVFAELVALADARHLPRTPALRFVSDLADNPTIDVIWVTRPLHVEALQLLQRRLDKRWSLCDAVSFLIMTERGVTDALTTDHHFEQSGFRRLLES